MARSPASLTSDERESGSELRVTRESFSVLDRFIRFVALCCSHLLLAKDLIGSLLVDWISRAAHRKRALDHEAAAQTSTRAGTAARRVVDGGRGARCVVSAGPHDSRTHDHDHDHDHHDNEHTNDHDHAHRDTASTSQVQLPLDDGTDRRFEVHPFIKSIVPSVWTRSQWPSSKLDPSVFIIGAQKAGTTSLHSWMLGAGITAPRDCAQGILIQRISSISISISEAPLVDSLGK